MYMVFPVGKEFQNDGFPSFTKGTNLYLSASQKAAVAHEMLPLLEAEAKERQRLAGEQHGRGMEKVHPLVDEPIGKQPQALEAAAKAVGVSKQYVSDMKTIAREAPGKVDGLN